METNQPMLFDLDEVMAQQPESGRRCCDCRHAERWQCNSKVICYCRARGSNRTENKMHKTKWRASACEKFEVDNE